MDESFDDINRQDMRKPDSQESFIEGSKDDPKVISEFNSTVRVVIFAVILFLVTEYFPEHSKVGFTVGAVAGGLAGYIVSPGTVPHRRTWFTIAAACLLHALYFAWRGAH